MPSWRSSTARLAMRLDESRVARLAMRCANLLGSPLAPFRVRVDGWTLHAPTVDRLAALLVARRGRSADPSLRLWRRACLPGTCAVDVGANMGLYSLHAALLVGATGRVVAVEPDRRNADCARRSFDAAGLRWITLHRVAALDRDGEVPLGIRGDHAGDHQVLSADRGRRVAMVACRRLDALIGDDFEVSAIKLDVQGAEGLAAEGLARTVDHHPRLVVLSEFWPAALRRCGTDPASYLSWWRSRGFSIGVVEPGGARTVGSREAASLVEHAESRGYVDLVLARDPDRWKDLLAAG